MTDENTVDKQIPNPENTTEQIDNPNYKAPVDLPETLDLNADPNKVVPAEIKVGKTGNAQIDAVGELFASKGIPNTDKLIAEYSKNGELSLTSQAQLIDDLGEPLAKVALNQLAAETARIKETNNKARTEILDYATKAFEETDPAATWAAIQDFVRSPDSGFSDDDRAGLTTLLAKGGLAAKLAIDKIHAVHSGNTNTTVTADLLAGDTHTTQGFKPLSAKSYSTEVAALADKHGYESYEVQQLQQRRERSRKAGY